MKNFIIKKQENKKISYVLVAIIWLLVWQTIAMIVNNPLLLPSITDSLKALIGFIGEGSFYLNCISTLLRTLASIILSYFLGIGIAWLAYRNENLERLLSLPVAFFKAVPVMAIIIYFIIMVNSDYVAILVSFLMCFPVVYTNALAGYNSCDEKLLELAQVNKLSFWETYKYIYIPSMRENLKSALSLIAGMSWKAVIAAEILAIPASSIGYEMLNAKYYLETPSLFAYIAVVIALSIGLEKLIIKFTQRQRIIEVKTRAEQKNIEIGPDNLSCTISFEDVSKSFDGKSVLNSLSFNLKTGETLAIMAPSGSGKTTIGRILAGLESVDSGKVEFDGDIKLSYLFQEDRLIPWMNVYNNIVIGNIPCADKDNILEISRKLEIEEYLEMYPDQLSGGISHRVAIARAMISNSNVFILDEPFRGLDEELKNRVIERIWPEISNDKAVLLISHNQEDCNNLSDRIINL